MSRKIIGFCGVEGSGKDTAANYLVNLYEFQKDSFAKSLKDAAAIIFNWPRHLLEGDTEESRKWRETVDDFWSVKLDKPGFTPRIALEKLGTESGRAVFGQTLWTSSLESRIMSTEKNVVISDVRFPNEIEFVRSLGGRVFEVYRDSVIPSWYKDANDFAYNGGVYDNFWSLPESLKHVHPSKWAFIGSEDVYAIIHNYHDLPTFFSHIHNALETFE